MERARNWTRDATAGELTYALAWAHGLYYAITGIWPILHMPSFELITSPKRDDWLVKTAGGLIATIGAVLCLSARRKQVPPEVPVLAVGAAGTLAAIDFVYVKRRVIPPIYLLDGIAEIVLTSSWIAVVLSARRRSGR